MKIKVHSNVGRRRSSNQDYADYYTNSFDQTLLILCDGVGGHQAGDIASQKTTQFLGERFSNVDHAFTLETMRNWVENAIIDVNEYIYEESIREPHLEGMGTTLVVATVVEDQLVVAHVGDSRAYVFHNEILTQITEDHSLVNELIKTGEITVEQGKIHPQRNVVTQSIGGTLSVQSEFNILPIDQVEVLLLCSDGLSNMVNHDQMQQMFKEYKYADDFAEKLIEAANEAGGTDNITVILVSELSDKEVQS